MRTIREKLVLGASAAALGIGLTAGGPALADDITITMAAPDWPPTRFMKEEFDRTYQSPDGHNTTLDIDFIPWPSFYERVAASLASGEQKYQMIVTDSQWLGAFVEGGYYLDLTDLMIADPELSAIMEDLHPALVSAYSTYPHKTKDYIAENSFPAPDTRYYGFPQFPDTYVTFYREDLFCNEGEAASFQERFGQTLPCTYEDWQDVDWDTFRNIGEHFQRAAGDPLGDGVADDDFFGIAFQAGKGYDFSTMQINAFIYQYGGEIWDETEAPNAQAEGVVNSAHGGRGVRALSRPPAVHAAGGTDRADGHLRHPGPVHAGQGGGDRRLGRPGRAGARPEHLAGARQVGLRGRPRACARRTARSTEPAVSAASPSS